MLQSTVQSSGYGRVCSVFFSLNAFVSASIPKRCVSKPASCDNALKCPTILIDHQNSLLLIHVCLYVLMRNTLAYSAERVTTRNTCVAVHFPILTRKITGSSLGQSPRTLTECFLIYLSTCSQILESLLG
jgi:hypothetical protein